MPLATLRQLLDEAASGGYAVGAFNVSNMEQVQAVMEAARATRSPVVLQTTDDGRRYANGRFLVHLAHAATEVYPEIPVALHLDHGSSVAACLSAIEEGFTGVMMDGSLAADGRTPAGFEDNVAVTREVVERAHAAGVAVEGELGTIVGAEDGRGVPGARLTDPDQAVEFVERTGIDALAVAIGTSSGSSKFSRPPTDDMLAMDVVEAIHERLPKTHLVMHGSSSLPKELFDRLNAYGGNLTRTWGVPVGAIRRGIDHGVRKVNVDTDARLAMTGALRQALVERPEDVDPRSYLGAARDAMTAVYEVRMRQFGQAGHAGDFTPMSLDAARVLYSS